MFGQAGVGAEAQSSWPAADSSGRYSCLKSAGLAPCPPPPACVSVSKSTVRSRVRSFCFTMRASAAMAGWHEQGGRGDTYDEQWQACMSNGRHV